MKSIKELKIWNRQFSENKTNKPPPHLTLTTEIFLIPLKLSFYPFYNKKQSAF